MIKNKINKIGKIISVIGIGLMIGIGTVGAVCSSYDNYTFINGGDVYPADLYRFENWLGTNPTNYLTYDLTYIAGIQRVGVEYQGYEDYEDLPINSPGTYKISLHLITEDNGNHILEIYQDNVKVNQIALPASISSSARLMIMDVTNSQYSNIRICDDLIEEQPPMEDITPPNISNLTFPKATTYKADKDYTFGAIITDENLSSVTFNIDNKIQPITNIGNEFISIVTGLSVGTHSFFWTASDVAGNTVKSNTNVLIINKAPSGGGSGGGGGSHHHETPIPTPTPTPEPTPVPIPTPTPIHQSTFLEKNWLWLSATGLSIIGGITALFALKPKKKRRK
jgi:hypothetical protein